MRIWSLVAITLLVDCAWVSAEDPDQFFTVLKQHGQRIEIRLERQPFRLKDHKITTVAEGVFIDGRKPLGTDYTAEARTELKRFEIKWNGRKIPIPRSFFRDCYNVHLDPSQGHWDTDGSVYVLVSEDGRSLLLSLAGSDAAGAYTVWWIITKAGQITRFSDDEGP